jgi:predicted enzyme related to lactoylglutathione lyase
MANNPVCWFEIYVQDMPRAKAFYEAVLQASLTQLNVTVPEIWAFPANQEGRGTSGALVRMPGYPAGGNSNGTLVYFSCADCAVEAGRVADAGGRLQREKMSIGQYGFVALAYDTEGNLFGLHSLK